MAGKLQNALGYIYIEHTVLTSIINAAVMECSCVVGMKAKSTKGGLADRLRRDNSRKGIKVHVEGNRLNIDLFIIIKFGESISNIVQDIVQTVKYRIENITGLQVNQVNVNIQGVQVDR